MMLLRASVGGGRRFEDPAHPHVWLAVPGTWSGADLDRISRHLWAGNCVHVTLRLSRGGGFPARRHAGATGAEVRERLLDFADAAGPHASRVLVRIEHEPAVLRRWWDAWAWRRGVGGAGRASVRERALADLLEPVAPQVRDQTTCAGRLHVPAPANTVLSLDVIDELDRSVSAGREAHLVLAVPDSPALHDPELHVLWERCVALDVADRRHEVALLWPDSSLVRVELKGRPTGTGEARRGHR